MIVKDGAGRSAAAAGTEISPTVAHGAGPNGTMDGVMVTGSLVTLTTTARRPLLVKPTVLGATVTTVDAAAEVGNGTCYEFTRNTGLGNQLDFLHRFNHLNIPRDSHNSSQRLPQVY